MSQLLHATSLTACSTACKQDSRLCQSKRFSFGSSVRLHKPFVGDRVAQRQAPQPRAVCRTPTVCITKVGEAEFQSEVLKSDTPVLVDFWATWCGPCKLIEKPLANLEKELDGKLKIVKVEADPNPGLVEKYKVYGLPTLVVFKDGKVLDGSQREGAISEAELRKYLDKWEVGN